MADRPTRNCNRCDDTGSKDYAGFAMDPCDHSRPAREEVSGKKTKAAAEALSDLNMAYAIIALCENSLFRTDAGHQLQRDVIAACKEHTGKMLREYDRNRK